MSALPRLRAIRRSGHTPRRATMALGEHLAELRHRVVVVASVFAGAGVVAFLAYGRTLELLLAPYCEAVGPGHSCHLYVTGPLDGLSLRVEVAAYTALAMTLPIIFWQGWRFVAPGLLPRERRRAVAFVTSSTVLFVAGATVAFAVFPRALRFLDTVGGPSLHELYSPSSYVGLLLLMMAAFGVTFELPVLLVFLQLAGVVTPARLASWRRWAIVALVTLAAVITPSSDPFSMLAMAVPLLIFYEASIVIGRLVNRSRSRAGAT
ncbi:MAG: twin-arginine translocase subunit TatC [Acidimicrobiales bacterium]